MACLQNFAAIDFETANYAPSSVCSVGVVIVRDGAVVNEVYRLIRPEPNWYVRRFTEQIHGLSRRDTDNAPPFPVVWAEIAPLVQGLVLVAHFAQFDEGCLKAAHAAYGLPYPGYTFRCTCVASRQVFGSQLPNHQLQTVAARCGFDLTRHHNAIADAEACAAIALKIMEA
jgi:DNA polymerase-3 subunit epsilon